MIMINKMQCPVCHAVFTDQAIYCPNCGQKLRNESIYDGKKSEKTMTQSPVDQERLSDRRTIALKKSETTLGTKVWIEYNGRRIPVENNYFRIGADREISDLLIDIDVISSDHAEIVRHEDRYYLIDLNSTNGTYLNGTGIPPEREIELKDEDIITFANIDTVFHRS